MPNQGDQAVELQEIIDLQGPKRKWPRRLMVIMAALAVCLAGLWYFGRPPGAAAQIKFRTSQVSRGDLAVIVSATGTLEPVNQVDVGTEVSGTIRAVLVDFNDLVKEGQVLALLDTAKLEAQRDQAQAALAVAQAELQNASAGAAEAKTKLERLQHTFEASGGRLPSRQDLDAARATYDKALAQVGVAKATIAQSRASLKGYESDLGKATIKAPITGMVLDRQIEPGQTVAASLSAPVLFTLAESLAGMSLCVSVDEADVGRVKEGQRATFVVDAYPDQRFPARITQVRFAPQDSSGVVTYECLLEVDNSDLLLRPGMTATADIVTTEVKDAVLVPNAALRFSPAGTGQEAAGSRQPKRSLVARIMPGPPPRSRPQKQSSTQPKNGAGQTVWILEDNHPVPQPVSLGPSDGVNTQVVSGQVEPGQMVIIGQETAAK